MQPSKMLRKICTKSYFGQKILYQQKLLSFLFEISNYINKKNIYIYSVIIIKKLPKTVDEFTTTLINKSETAKLVMRIQVGLVLNSLFIKTAVIINVFPSLKNFFLTF